VLSASLFVTTYVYTVTFWCTSFSNAVPCPPLLLPPWACSDVLSSGPVVYPVLLMCLLLPLCACSEDPLQPAVVKERHNLEADPRYRR
jgi:hypothetical protein